MWGGCPMSKEKIIAPFKKYTFPRQTFTFTSPFKSLGDYPSGVTANRIFSVYASYLGDNTGGISFSLGNGAVYALGDVGKTMTDLEVTIVYI